MRITMLIVSVAAIAACSRGGPDTKPADTLKAVSSTTSTAVSTAAVPYYEVVGHHAENAYDYVKAADWAAAPAR